MQKKLTLPALLTIAALILNSCTKEAGDIQNVNDYKTLSSMLAAPPAEYTPAPFFVWNAEITDAETDRFLQEFSDAGIKQVFIHPRPGLVTEYLSDDWFARFRHAVDKGKELGMKVWIYDENSYPSGFAGGHVPAEMPGSYNQGQGLSMKRVEILPDSLSDYLIILKDEDGVCSDITLTAGNEKGKTGKYILYSKTFYGKSDWYGGFSYVDLLLPGVTEKFIELTMSGYEKIAGEEFGNTIPGTFTDEPEIPSPGGIRFTPDLFEVFLKQWGYDLKTSLPSLFEETGDWKKIRHNYTQTLLDLFIERWSKPWYEYCESKGIAFTGHYWEHEWPNMRNGGDNMAMYAWQQVPAIDMLFNQWDDSTYKAQFGNIRSVKELASAANQTGRLRKLSETYGGSGWDLTFTDMKRNGDWEYALGVNLMNQHLTYYTMAGARKYDYPPTFDYHEPWWNNYKILNDHYSRLSLALSAGRQKNDMLVLEPTTSCWLYDSYAKRNNNVHIIGQAFQSFVTALEKQQTEYDLGSERIISDLGKVTGKKFVVGSASYSTVVIPPLTENLNRKTFELLKSFAANGGKLVLFSEPKYIDGMESSELSAFVNQTTGTTVKGQWPDNDFADKYSGAQVKFKGVAGGTLYHQTRILDDGKLIFMVNSDLGSESSGTVICNGASVSELNTLTGEIKPYYFEKGEETVIKFRLPPAGSLLLFVHDLQTGETARPELASREDTVAIALPVVAKRISDNVMMIDFCDLTLGDKTEKDLHVFTANDRLFRHHGFKNGNPWNTSVQYKRNIVDRDTFGTGTGFSATYRFTVKDKFDMASVKVVAERPGQWKVSLNGVELMHIEGEWWLDRSFGVYNADGIRTGENELTVEMTPMKLSGEIEPVYIKGNFDVEPSGKGWVIRKPGGLLTTGNWTQMGLPFYSDKVSYSTKVAVAGKDGRYYFVAKDWKGTVAEVHVNGTKAGLIAFPPYEADITDYMAEGENTVDFIITGSLRNLLGPHHRNPPVGFASPWNWRYVEKYPPGKDYSLYEYGLNSNFAILNRK